MKRRLIRVVAALTAVMTLAAVPASAELRRGDRNGVVQQLQQMLVETGWLFEEPDGIFGKNTEQAVKDFEEWAGLPVDGIADDIMIENLGVAHDAQLEELSMEDEYVYDEYNGGAAYAEYCSQWVDASGNVNLDLCGTHYLLHENTDFMMQESDPAVLEYVLDTWSDEVYMLYDRWAEAVPAEEQGSILTNKAVYLASIDAMRAGGTQTAVGIVENLRNQASMLCNLIWTATGGATEPVIYEENAAPKAIRLNGSAVIDGYVAYFSGDLVGEGEGVYVMNADGTDRIKLWNQNAQIAAVSNGSLLLWDYDTGAGSGSLFILRPDGSTVEVADQYNGHAIAAEGRFYWGSCSVKEDGSDMRYLFTDDPGYFQYFWPLEVVNGYLYFLDNYEQRDSTYYMEGTNLPPSANLNRIDLVSESIDFLCGPGAYYYGIEDGVLYYAINSFMRFDDETEEYATVSLDDGMYYMYTYEQEEYQLFPFEDSDVNDFETYYFLENGVFYGEGSNYAYEEPYSIIRRTTDGEILPPIRLPGATGAKTFCVVDGVHYSGSVRYPNEHAEDFSVSYDVIIANNVRTGETNEIRLPVGETMFYSEVPPEIAVVEGRIYYYTYNTLTGSEYFKSVDMNGGDEKVLAETKPYFNE